jgi:hypothetical protein
LAHLHHAAFQLTEFLGQQPGLFSEHLMSPRLLLIAT